MTQSKKQPTKQGTSDEQPGAVLTNTHNAADDELLTTRELMAFLNLSRTKVWELVQQEQLPAFKLGGDYRYRRSEIVQWLERYRVNQ